MLKLARYRLSNKLVSLNATPECEYEAYIYIDSSYSGAFSQIKPYFDTGFFNKNKVKILFKCYLSNAKQFQQACAKNGVACQPFVVEKDLPVFKNAVFFYTHNAYSNIRNIVRQTSSKHALLLHGDSEKPASANMFARMYDYCLVSGSHAFNRYIDAGVFTKHDEHKMLYVGKAALNLIIPDTSKNTQQAVFVAPTWEGVNDDCDYSFLSNPELWVRVVSSICEQANTKYIVFKPHPNTGKRKKSFIQSVELIAHQLQLKGIKVAFVEADYNKYRLVEGVDYYPSLTDITKLKLLITCTNISAIVAQSLFRSLKTFVVQDHHSEEMLSPAVTLLPSLDVKQMEKCIAKHLNDNLELQDELVKCGKLTYQDPNWASLSDNELFKKIIKYIQLR